MKEILKNMFDELQKDMEAECKITGMPSGLLEIDFYTTGFKPGNVYVLSGKKRALKTALMLNISFFLAGFPYFIRYYSLDSSPDTLTRRMLFASCNISITTYPYNTPNFVGIRKLHAAGELLKQSRFKFVCNSILDFEQIENDLKSKKPNEKSIILIDSFQLFAYGKRHSSVLKQIKELAVNWNIPIIVAYDIKHDSRVNENFLLRNGADTIFVIHKEVERNFGITEDAVHVFLEILKQKDGQSASFSLLFEKDAQRFYNEEAELLEDKMIPNSFDNIATC